MSRPTWDQYFIAMAYLTSVRSKDPHTHVGAVIIDQENHIPVSFGYNSYPRRADDQCLPKTRPEKYSYISHAEINAIANAASRGAATEGCTIYVTHIPCETCFRSLINAGIKRVVYCDNKTNSQKPNKDEPTIVLAKMCGIELEEFKGSIGWINNIKLSGPFD